MNRVIPLIAIGMLFLLMRSARTARAAEEKSKPNVIIFLADDMGFSDAECYGGEIRGEKGDKDIYLCGEKGDKDIYL